MSPRSSRPDETPPRRHGGRLSWLVGAVPGAVAVAFLAIVVVVVAVLLF